MFNSHVHTENSRDCTFSLEEMVLAAKEKGFFGISATDHCDLDFCISGDLYRRLLSSGEKVRELNKKYADSFLVTVGIELSDATRKPEYAKRLIKALRPDSISLSVHNIIADNMPVGLSHMDFGTMSSDRIDSVLNTYFSDLLAAVKNADFDICAHLTLPLRYITGVYKKTIVLENYMPQIKKILSVLIDRNKALEINTSDTHHQLCDFMPPEEIAKMFFNMGGRLVTIGTDAHSPQNIDYGFAEGKNMLNRIGFDSYVYYRNRKAQIIKI